MDPVTIVCAIVAAVLVFAIAAGTIGREAHRLDAIAPRAVYRLDEAVDFVADRLPAESQARLTPAEVEALLIAHLRWLHEQGLQPEKVVDARQSIDENVIISEDALVAYLLEAAEEADVELLDDVDAVNVVDAHLEYFQAIGAVGPEAPLDDVLWPSRRLSRKVSDTYAKRATSSELLFGDPTYHREQLAQCIGIWAWSSVPGTIGEALTVINEHRGGANE